jgi:NAD(P)-dependent dehydrogenase (short-subunit alcohol dehydrogenase family)
MYLRGKPDLERALVEASPAKRIATTEEIAASVTFLCTDAAAYITGHALAIDGGVLAV